MVALRKVPVQLAFRGPKDFRAPLVNARFQTADGLKPSVRLLVHTFNMTVEGATCSSILHPARAYSLGRYLHPDMVVHLAHMCAKLCTCTGLTWP